MSTPPLRFPKSSRLYLRKEINTLVTTGKSFHAGPLKVLYQVVPAEKSPLKFAVSVPKRNFRLAVIRNRIKRQIREAFRLNSAETRQYFTAQGVTLQLLVVYTGKIPPDYVG